MVLVYALKGDKKNASPVRASAPATAVAQLTTIPAATFAKVDTSALTGGPSKITGTAADVGGQAGDALLRRRVLPLLRDRALGDGRRIVAGSAPLPT